MNNSPRLTPVSGDTAPALSCLDDFDLTGLPVTLASLVSTGRVWLRRADAEQHGIDDASIRRWGRSGYLSPLGQGLHVINVPVRQGVTVATRRRYAHVHLAQALAVGFKDAYLVGHTAALAHGLPVSTPREVELARTNHGRSRRPHVRIYQAWGQAAPVAGVQSVAECLIEIAASDGFVPSRIIAQAALSRGLVTPYELHGALESFGRRAGTVAARTLVESTAVRQHARAA